MKSAANAGGGGIGAVSSSANRNKATTSKKRQHQQQEEEEDYAIPCWAGVLPLDSVPGEPIDDGRLVYREDIAEGIETAPAVLAGLYEGRNMGRQLVRVRPDPTL